MLQKLCGIRRINVPFKYFRSMYESVCINSLEKVNEIEVEIHRSDKCSLCNVHNPRMSIV